MSGAWIRLKASDGHEFAAWRSGDGGRPKAGLVILQEIFGVNGHIRRVTDRFASMGYLAIAPALFDRVRPDVQLGYDQLEEGRGLMQRLELDDVVRDVEGAIDAAAEGTAGAGSVGVVGYCWGGAIADLAACRTAASAAVAYYGRANVNWLEEKPQCPVLYHFGALDPLIPPDVVAKIRAGRPGHEVHVYPEAGHGFNCDERHEFHAPSAALALERTLRFLDRHLT